MVFQLTKKLAFPDPHWGAPDGLLAIGGRLVGRPAHPGLFQRHLPLVCVPTKSHPMVVPLAAFRHLPGRDSHLPLHAHADE